MPEHPQITYRIRVSHVPTCKYSWRMKGFFRMNVCGLRFVAIDTRKHFTCYSDRAHGWRVGPFLFRVSRP